MMTVSNEGRKIKTKIKNEENRIKSPMWWCHRSLSPMELLPRKGLPVNALRPWEDGLVSLVLWREGALQTHKQAHKQRTKERGNRRRTISFHSGFTFLLTHEPRVEAAFIFLMVLISLLLAVLYTYKGINGFLAFTTGILEKRLVVTRQSCPN